MVATSASFHPINHEAYAIKDRYASHRTGCRSSQINPLSASMATAFRIVGHKFIIKTANFAPTDKPEANATTVQKSPNANIKQSLIVMVFHLIV
jgi:hypothetical protein